MLSRVFRLRRLFLSLGLLSVACLLGVWKAPTVVQSSWKLVLAAPESGVIYVIGPGLPADQRGLEVRAEVIEGERPGWVELYVDGELLARRVAPPYATTWWPTAGRHTFRAHGLAADGIPRWSQAVTVTVEYEEGADQGRGAWEGKTRRVQRGQARVVRSARPAPKAPPQEEKTPSRPRQPARIGDANPDESSIDSSLALCYNMPNDADGDGDE